jgi:exopolysaccharide biosynthesis polyprenyl glycosylphosphotransferase
MNRFPSTHILAVFLGDVVLLYVSLYATLGLRFLALPSRELFILHAVPFSLIFIFWILAFYVASLYEPHTVVFKSKIPSTILRVEAWNSAVAVLFFYLIPVFGITPKTTLFLFLFVSFVLITLWRVFGVQFLGLRKKERALLVGAGREADRLFAAVNANPLYPMSFYSRFNIKEGDATDAHDLVRRIRQEEGTIVVIDLDHDAVSPHLPVLYELLFDRVRFVPQHAIYEDIFDRIPISLIGHRWFLEHISSRTHFGYDMFKRSMDVLLSLLLAVPTLIIFPIVAFLIWWEDKGPVFYTPLRVGEGNIPFRIFKFRTMTSMDGGRRLGESVGRVTRIGSFLRKSRIDELPQLWNVISGDLSLIGPRPEFPDLVSEYAEQIPYYNMRHLIKPGLSGWAQVHHEKPPQTVEETKEKLSYDLYYLKHRSPVLDIKIALKTVRTLLSRTGV